MGIFGESGGYCGKVIEIIMKKVDNPIQNAYAKYMDFEVNLVSELKKLHRRQLRTKFVILTIVSFLALLTYLLINVSQRIASNESVDFRSRAQEMYGDPQLNNGTNNGDFSGGNNTDFGKTDNIDSNVPGQSCRGNYQ